MISPDEDFYDRAADGLNYLLGPQAARLRVYVSVVFVFGFSVLLGAGLVGASPGLIVTGPWLALVLAWLGVSVAAYRRARARPAASISAPNAGLLARDARSSRQHATEFGFPTGPWTQLEVVWTWIGELPLADPEIDPSPEQPDPFMDEFRSAMCTPLGTPLKVNEALSPDSPVSFAARLANRLLTEFDEVDPLSARAETLRENLREWDAEFARRYGETRDAAWVDASIAIHNRLAADLETRRRHDEPFDLDAFVRRTRTKLRTADTPERRAAVEAYVAGATTALSRMADAASGSLADLATRTGSTVEIVNGAGRVVAVHPSSDADQVRCTWPLSGEFAEDAEVVATLRSHGVKVATEMYGGQLVAHLSGTHGALKAARAAYMRGLRERAAAGKVTG